jgi:hypothetical protein
MLCLFSLPDKIFLSTTVLPALTLVHVSSPTSRHSATLSWIPHSTAPLDSPPDLLTLSQPLSLQPQPLHLVCCNPPELPLACNPSHPCVSIITLVTSSQSALGFPCSTPRNKNSFLSNRRVVFNGSLSNIIQLESRIPQGSCLGP